MNDLVVGGAVGRAQQRRRSPEGEQLLGEAGEAGHRGVLEGGDVGPVARELGVELERARVEVREPVGARACFHPRHALLSADRIAAEHGALAQRVEALQLLVELSDGAQRVRSLRALADLHRGPLGEPDVAVELMRELLLLRPTDLDVLRELHRALNKLDRAEEAKATLLAGIAHHRAWLRASGVRSEVGDELIDHAPVRGLRELFDRCADIDGVYLATAILEVTADDPHRADEDGRAWSACDKLQVEPWPLPNAQDGKPLDLLVGDLPCSHALDLLHEGVFLLAELPDAPPPPVPVTPGRSLPGNAGVVMVARALADALGIPQPLVFVNPKAEDTVVAHLGSASALIVGRKINSSPFAPWARDRIGRAMMRLATGGDYLNADDAEPRLLGLLMGLCRAVEIELPENAFAPAGGDEPLVDRNLAEWVVQSLPDPTGRAELVAAARAFAQATDTFGPGRLRDSLAMAQDRAGVIAAADPHAALERLIRTPDGQPSDDLTSERGTALLGYLLSDDHLGLRRALGYRVALVQSEPEELIG